jgi:hypothetical protein
MAIFYGEELLAPRPNHKLEDHPLSAVRDCLFIVFSISGARSSFRNPKTRHAVGSTTELSIPLSTFHVNTDNNTVLPVLESEIS